MLLSCRPIATHVIVGVFPSTDSPVIECTNKDYCGENECVMEQTRAIARRDDIHRHANKGRDVCFFN